MLASKAEVKLSRWIFLIMTLTCSISFADTGGKRIAALTWEATEHLLKLNIVPVAVAEAEEYRRWVGRPKLDATVIDAGLRTEPNLELLIEIEPDLILISPMLEDMRLQLERIAPVRSMAGFSLGRDNYMLQRENFLALAEELNCLALAKEKLQEFDQKISTLKEKIQKRFANRPPEVTVINLTTPTTVLMYGENSMPQRALDLLGVKSGYPIRPSAWGITQTSVMSLKNINQGIVIYLEPFHYKDVLFDTKFWQSMPFVKKGMLRSIPTTWSYGGVFSIQYLAEAMSAEILE